MSTCISRHGEFGSHELDNAYTCTLCGVLDEDALTAELRRLRTYVVTCSCGTSPETYEGPESDCPVHGAVRAYNDAAAERDALRVGVQAIIDDMAPRQGRISIVGKQVIAQRLDALLNRTSITGE